MSIGYKLRLMSQFLTRVYTTVRNPVDYRNLLYLSRGRAHSLRFPSVHLRHNSFFNPSVALPTSQLIPQPFRCFTSQPFRHFTYVTTHSPTFPSLYLRHSSFSNPSVASPTSQLILQPFFRLSYVTGSSVTSSGEPPMVINMMNNGHMDRGNENPTQQLP